MIVEDKHILTVEVFDDGGALEAVILNDFTTWKELRTEYETKYRDHELVTSLWKGRFEILHKDKYGSECMIQLFRK